MSTAVVKMETNLPAQADLGGEEILNQNIVVPRVLLMQGLSDLVTEGKAQMGDLVRSTNGEKLGGPDKPLEFIPITFTNTWILSELVGKKYEYRAQEPLSAKNQDLPWEFEKNGTKWKRTKSLNLFALLVSDARAELAEMEKAKQGEMPDPDKALLPVMISFRSTSFVAGKDVVTHFAKARKFSLPGYVSVLRLKCAREKNDKGTYFVFEVENAGKTPQELMETCKYWQGTLASRNVQVHDEGKDAESGAVSGGSQF